MDKDELFKQLARKTQECEELKDKINFMEGYIKTVENARDELERENKFSKEQAEQKLEQIKTYATCPPDTEEEYGCKFCRNKYLNKTLKVIDEVE